MNSRVTKISVILLSLASVIVATNGWCNTTLSGSAQLSYVKYEAAENGKDFLSGSSLAQQYSVSYTATNQYYRNQSRYYDLMVGYDLINFSTKVTEPAQETDIKQNSGRIKYSGAVGYNAAGVPIRFNAYINDNTPRYLNSGITYDNLISDGLAYNIQRLSNRISSGVSLAFDSEISGVSSIRALPKVYFDYRETTTKSSEGSDRVDNKTREISVAGLNKENNWLNYRLINYENYLQPLDNHSQQQIQIGLVDQRGYRKWSSLTNWIEVSADGQLTNRRAAESFEEYDVNFMAIAIRRTWQARTFMNYNRIMNTYANFSASELTETARIPLYVRGSYGPETDWYMRVSAERGTQTLYKPAISKESSYANTVAVGGTTFKRSYFTLSPSLSATTSKGFGGADALALVAAVETNSTARYSNKVGLAAREEFRYNDAGYDAPSSKTWHNTVNLRANYRPDSKFAYSLNEFLEVADAAPSVAIPGYSGTKHYLRTTTNARLGWTPNASFTTSLEGSYALSINEDNASTNETLLMHRLSFDKKETTYRLDTKYIQKDDNQYGSGWELINTGDFQYRPDRYHDGMLRYIYTKNEYNFISSSKLELIQKYDYNFFARAGVVRKLATVSQELGYTSEGGTAFGTRSSHYLLLSGRYSPTERLSLYGAVKYSDSNPGSVAIYYNAGLNADFKLLSTSLDYALAKRDSDNRIEKRFSASVRRTF